MREHKPMEPILPLPATPPAGAAAPAPSSPPLTPTREDLIIALADIEECEPEEIHIPSAEEDPDLVTLDAFASRLLRARKHVEDRLEHARALAKAEIEQLRLRFARQMAGLEREGLAIEAGLDELSKSVPYPKGKKSRTVGAGRYGRRTIPQGVEIIDEEAFIGWATAKEPGLVKPVTKIQIERANLKKYVKESGDLPVGTQLVPERDVLSYAFADEESAAPTAAPGGEA